MTKHDTIFNFNRDLNYFKFPFCMNSNERELTGTITHNFHLICKRANFAATHYVNEKGVYNLNFSKKCSINIQFKYIHIINLHNLIVLYI